VCNETAGLSRPHGPYRFLVGPKRNPGPHNPYFHFSRADADPATEPYWAGAFQRTAIVAPVGKALLEEEEHSLSTISWRAKSSWPLSSTISTLRLRVDSSHHADLEIWRFGDLHVCKLMANAEGDGGRIRSRFRGEKPKTNQHQRYVSALSLELFLMSERKRWRERRRPIVGDCRDAQQGFTTVLCRHGLGFLPWLKVHQLVPSP